MRPAEDYTIRLSSLTLDEILDIAPLNYPLHEEVVANALSTLRQTKPNFSTEELIAVIPNIVQQGGASNADKTSGLITSRLKYYLNQSRYIGSGFDWADALQKDSIIDINCRGFERRDLQAILAATLRELKNLRQNISILPFVIF